MCNCLKITFQDTANSLPPVTIEMQVIGTLNGYNYWSFDYYGTTYFVWHDASSNWYISETLGSAPYANSIKTNTDPCPLAESPVWTDPNFYTLTEPCVSCSGNEDRTYREYKSIKLPKKCIDQNRGLPDCCCEELVLADNSGNSFQNDKVSAWMKLSDPTDSVDFKLYKDGVLTTYTPTAVAFAQEDNAYYTTIDWIDVLTSDGIGCYELKIEYNVSGIIDVFTWGQYRLLPYTIQNALKTARLRAEFSGYHEIEGINFTGSGIESTFRFYGYIGNRQPNMEIDNIIYNNREMKRVIRENLNDYEVISDPALKCVTEPLVDLYFLSENNLYISDYNAHNHDYCIKDLPVIVSDSPEITYYEFSRKASVRCKVADKFKNKRTYY
jgi:hypothetical protein